jgi:nucleoside-diphosphate-sugar epimerase
MQYFVTGATGFIGKRLVKKLLERKGSVVYFLIRKESEGKVAALREYWAASAARVVPVLATSPPKSSVSPLKTSRNSRARSTTSTTWPPCTT